MRKQNILTYLGIALSFAIAVGGWGFTSMLINLRSDALLSTTGITTINAQPAATQPPEISSESNIEAFLLERPKLTEVEIFKILLNWETHASEWPHEPMEGQLTMEQAIDVGRAGLSYFYALGIIPEELLEYKKTNMYLCQRQPSSGESRLLNPYFSYWRLSFSGENGHIEFIISAITGQIWSAELGLNTSASVVREVKAEQLLDVFTAYLGLTSGGAYATDGATASASFADGTLRAVAQSIFIAERNQYRMSMYLSVQVPTTE